MSILPETSTDCKPAGEFANELAAFGQKIFPCDAEKKPLTPHGFKDATDNLDAVKKWWQKWPDALVAVATGLANDLVVLDIDPRNGGNAWLAENESKLPHTLRHTTRSGGVHYIFKHPGGRISCSAGKIAPGVDVRGDGGYLIWWPAHGFIAKNHALAAWPEWLAPPLPDVLAERAPAQADLLAVDEAELAAIVKQLPNDLTREDWIGAAHAIAAAFADNPSLAQELFFEFSMKYPGADETKIERVWDTLIGPHYCGAQHLISLAVDAGIDVYEYSVSCAQAVFTAEPPPPGGVPVWKSDLFVNKADLTETASALRDVLARKSKLFERGGIVKIAYDATEGGMVALPVTVQTVIREAHRFVKPWQYGGGNAETPKQISITLPQTVAALYLDMIGEWNLPVLNGTTSAPILSADGTIRTCEGFDSSTGLYCEKIPDLRGMVPDKPSRADAEKALAILRDMLSTFPFADRQSEQMRLMRLSPSILESENSDLINKYKDTNSLKFPEGDNSECSGASSQPHQPPLLIGIDESTALVSLLTAVCRPSIPLSPGVLITAPAISGAGTGKGLLARVLNTVAFGRAPQAFTGGTDRTELDKRIAAELIGAAPSMMLDNLNGISLRSDILASAITERPARVRILGQSRMLPLNSSAFIVVTGNGLTVSEDLARRFIRIELDAGIEDPESRSFTGDLLAEVRVRRAELLSAVLTIWRWGRQNNISRGKPLGSFSEWCSWVRDPLLALGCSDPVERIGEVKANDPHRRMTADLFNVWHDCHGEKPMKVSALDTTVTAIIDPAARGLQFRSRAVGKLVGTRLGGFTLVCSAPSGNHGAAYAVKKTT